MRIVRLNLRAYGHFTDYVLEFGEKPGFHVIYGANEAGKSTTLRALTSVLFGYPQEVEDGFRHGAKDIALGIDLIAKDSRPLSFIRKRRGRDALADATGARLDEAAIANFLGGLSKDAFTKVFALDHHRLREHARALLEEGGALGVSLAGAGSGIAGLKAILDKLKAERAAIFLPGGVKPRLNKLISDLTELRKLGRQRTMSLNDYKKRDKEIRDIEDALTESRARQRAIGTDIRRLQRIQKNLGRRAEHAAHTHILDELSSVPLLPPEAAQQRVKALTDHDTAKEAVEAAAKEIDALNDKIAAITLDERILAARAEIKRIANRRPVIEQQQEDLPRREGERRQHVNAVRDLLAKAELSGDPENLEGVLVSLVKRRAISKLLDEGKALAVQSTAAAEQVDDAESELQRAQARLAEAPEVRDTSDLARVLAAADRLGDIGSEIARRTRAHERKAKILRETIVGLGVGGDVQSLRELAIPPTKTVERYVEALDTLDEQEKATAGDIARIRAEIGKVESGIAHIKTVGAIASEDDLKKARQDRDEGWSLVRRVYVDRRTDLDDAVKALAPDGRLPEAYEKLVASADQVGDAIRAHVKEATELSLLVRKKEELEQQQREATKQAETQSERRKTLLGEWQTLWPAGMTAQLPAEMLEWIARRADILAKAEELDAERDEIAALRASQDGAARALAKALGALGVQSEDDALDTLRACAHRVIQTATETKTARERAKEAVRQQTERKAKAEQLVTKLTAQTETWSKQWQTALTAANLRQDLSMEAASVILEAMSTLDVKKSEIDVLNRRIETMRKDWDAFRDEVAKLADLAPGPDAETPIEACRRIEARLTEAEAAEAELKRLIELRKTRETAKQQAEDKLRQSQTALESLCAQAGCSSPDELAEIEAKSATKKDALRERAAIEVRMLEDGGGLDVAALFAECEGVAGDEIPSSIETLEAEAEELARRIDELMTKRADLKSEFDRLLAQDQAADSFQAAKMVEAQMVEAVEDYVDLTLEEIALRQAIELYRQRNQGPILGRARILFSDLTDGVYAGLRADLDEKNRPILVAEHRTRGSLDVQALSDGTVDPLYLALRLAVVQEHNATREPAPFIADDLLLNFDDTRARAALRVPSRIALESQVLFFTHHTHMVELAKDSVPGDLLSTHILTAPAPEAAAAECRMVWIAKRPSPSA